MDLDAKKEKRQWQSLAGVDMLRGVGLASGPKCRFMTLLGAFAFIASATSMHGVLVFLYCEYSLPFNVLGIAGLVLLSQMKWRVVKGLGLAFTCSFAGTEGTRGTQGTEHVKYTVAKWSVNAGKL